MTTRFLAASMGVTAVLFSNGACIERSPTAPGQVAPVPPSPPVGPLPVRIDSTRDITVGEGVQGIFGDGRTINPGEHHFLVTAPDSGTLDVTLNWDPHLEGTLLKLKLNEREFRPTSPNWSPVTGQIPVEKGQRYQIAVALAGADWLPLDPFVLETRLISNP